MPQEFVIKTNGGTYRIRVDDGTSQQQAISLAVATNPKFAQEYSQIQAGNSLADRVGKDEANDTDFAKTIGMDRTRVDPKRLTNVVAPMVGAGLGIKSLASRVAPRVLRGPGATGDVSVNPATMAARELEAKVPRNQPPTARDEMYNDLGTRLQKRGVEQRKLDKASPQPSPFPGATSTGTPSMVAPTSGQTQVPQQSIPLSTRTAQAKAPEGSLARRIIVPGERVDPMPVEGAGSAAQATEVDLRRLAAAGDRSAAVELARRRLPMGPTDYSQMPLPRGSEPIE